MNRTKYNGIDLLKLIMAFCVVAIHTNPLENCTSSVINEIYDIFVSLAVPFFFIASGYLLATKLTYPYHSEKDIHSVANYLFKTIKLYLLWNLIYSPLAIYHYIASGTPLKTSVLLYIRGLFFIGEHYNSWILWYLLSAIYALFMIMFLLKRHCSPKGIVLIGFCVTVIGFGLDVLVEFEGNLPTILSVIRKLVFYTIANGRILQGAFYISFGMFMAHKKCPAYFYWIFYILGFGANYFISNPFVSSLLLMASAIGLFGIAESLQLKNSVVYPFIRKMSTVIYFIHLYIWTFYYKVVYGEKTFGADCFLVTSLCCILIAFVYVYCVNQRKQVRKSN